MRSFKSRAGAALAALVFVTDPGMQASTTSSKSYVVEGPGRMSCESLTAKPSDDLHVKSVSAWLSGYITAHNRLLDQVFDLTSWQTQPVLMSLLFQYCAANPTDIVENGAQDLVAFLLPTALTAPAEIVAVGEDENVVLLYLPVVVGIRDRLTQQGFAPASSMESLLGSIQAFQSQNAIDPTGLPNQETLALLFK